jgi:hypothetical protein
VPEDASQVWKDFTAQEDQGLHDPTWLTLTELLSADWDQALYEQCVALESEYLRWRETGEAPRYRSRGVGGPGMRVVNEVEYAAGVRGEQTAVDFRWRQGPLRESIPKAWWSTLAVMLLLVEQGKTDDVRMLLIFDS